MEIVLAVILLIVFTYLLSRKFLISKHRNKNNLTFRQSLIPLKSISIFLFQKEHFGNLVKTHYQKIKSAGLKHCGYFFLNRNVYVPVDLEIIKNILTKDFKYFVNRGVYYNKKDDPLSAHLFSINDAEWKSLRTKLTPTFSSGKMKMMFHILVQCGNQLKNFVSSLDLKEPIDIKDIVGSFTIDVIGSCAFGLDCNSFQNPNSDFKRCAQKMLSLEFKRVFVGMFSFVWPNLARRLGIGFNQPEVSNFYYKIIEETVNFRKNNNFERNDFLQLLIDLQSSHTENLGKLSLEEIAAQSFLFFVAGYETSASTLTFSLYELAMNQELQDRVRNEINFVLKKCDEEVTYEAISEMKFLEQVMNETLRKYPPISVLTRECVAKYNIPGTDDVIEKDVLVVISNYGLHYDPDYFPNPKQFNPDRFNNENKSKIHPYSYLPFGEGPRNCIGVRFAIVQVKVGLVMLLRNYRFSLNEKTKTPIQMNPRSAMLAALGSIWLNAEKILIKVHLVMSSFKMEYFVILLTFFIVGILAYFNWAFKYWERKNIPFRNPIIPFGTFLNVFLQREAFVVETKNHYDIAKKLGCKHYGFFIFSKPIYMPLDPVIVKHILSQGFSHFVNRGVYYNKRDDPIGAHLFSIDGAEWRTLREKLTPTFTSGKLKTMLGTLIQCGNQLKYFMDEQISAGEPLDIRDISGCFTTDIIGSCAFGLECNSFKNPNSDFRKFSKKVFQDSNWKAVKGLFSFFSPSAARRLRVRYNDKDVSDFFIDIVKKTIAYREENNVVRNDFLQLLINLKENEKRLLTIEQIAAQAFVFFIAGNDTSSSLMAYFMYELSLHHDIQDRVRKEVNNVLEKYDGKLTYEALSELKYMQQVIDETMRLYPSLAVLNRQCILDYKLPGDYGTIEKGTTIFISNYGLHHDSDYFPDPEKFDPDRFSNENRSKIVPFTYLPFGDGPRNCIGLRFGIMQAKVGLAILLQNYRFYCNEKTQTPFRFDPTSFVLAPLGKIWLNASKID